MATWDKDKRDKNKEKKLKRLEKQGLIAGVTTEVATAGTQTQAYQATYGANYNPHANKYDRGYGYLHTPQIATPTDTKDVTKLSIVLMRQSTLNSISAICQPVAGASEFQVHYRALVVRLKNETSEFILSIPTAFYNFEQKVATASVDYHLDNVEKAAAISKPISDMIIKDIFREFPLLGALSDMYDGTVEVTYSEVNSGSMHRHPGRFGFSGTDYTKNPRNPGVIYREAEATDKVHTDSVLYLGNRTEIYTTETRILNLKPVGDGVEGTYCQIPTTTYLLNDVTSEDTVEVAPNLTSILGELTSEIKDSSGDYYVTNAMGANSGYELVMAIIDAFKTMQVFPDISGVDPKHITSYSYGGARVVYGGGAVNTNVGGQSTKGKSQYQSIYGSIDAFDDDYWDDGYDYYYGKPSVNDKKVNKVETKKDDKIATECPVADGNPYKVNSAYWHAYNTVAHNGKH